MEYQLSKYVCINKKKLSLAYNVATLPYLTFFRTLTVFVACITIEILVFTYKNPASGQQNGKYPDIKLTSQFQLFYPVKWPTFQKF